MKKFLLVATFLFAGMTFFAQTTRLSLMEEFTGETCGPCAATNPGLNATLTANASKVIAIKWQVPIPSAPSNTWSLYQTNSSEPNARMTYYTVNSAPQARMDGKSLTTFGAPSDHAAYITPSLISSAQAITSPFSINMVRAWDATCSSVNLTITVQASANYTATSALRFRTVMVERLIQFSVQPGTNGETTFYDAAIKSFPSIQSGYTLGTAWTIGQTQTFTLNCPIPSYTRDKNQIAFVGFIQDEANKNVLQAFRADKVNLPTDALATLNTKVDVTCSSNITPQITVQNTGTNAVTAFTVTPFTDATAGAITAWTGNLAPNASTVITLNSVATSTTSGPHTFSYQLVMAGPYNLTNLANKVQYVVSSSSQTAPVAEDFSNSGIPAMWTSVNSNNGPSWSWLLNTGGYANVNNAGALKFDFYNNTVLGDVDEIYLPPLDLSGTATPTLSFDLAKALRNNENDELDVQVSKDCGLTWTNFFSNAGSGLATSAPISTAFLASSAADWITVTAPLVGFAVPNVLVKFVATNYHGNNMYIDNVNLSQPNPLGVKKINLDEANISVFPNPANSETTLSIKTVAGNNSTIKIINSIGQVVYTKQVSVNPGTTNLQIDTKEFVAGIYVVTIENGKNPVNKKLIISK